MKRQLVVGAYVAAGLVALPGVASAQSQAYTTSQTNVHAGPASDYPIVTQLPGGAAVTVMGCLSNYQWCDVAAPNLRGWVYAARLSSAYQGGYMPLNYGAALGLPILAFSIGDYWGNHYRGRSWYGQQSRWVNHAPPPPPRAGAGHPPANYRPPQTRPGGSPSGHAGSRPPGNAGGPPSGGSPAGNAGGRPPGGSPPGNVGGRPQGGPPPGNAGGRPSGGPQGGGGGRPPGGGPQGGSNRFPGGPQSGPPSGGGGGGGGGPRPPGGGGNN
ncbi:SH3 domain-containing protein [Paraburkholderia sp. HP33-1]|uniref:SH3 domain-containing protein n=1 Tax=Paraburkholderia sp. HP33-1 TaxID=2883243 RepID=UPI001F32C14E|nr:SH3 domain-containing protein [Paraburkholderia sp. HP33-1]